MKTILVPTDFSAISRNSIDYAVEIAKVTKAKLILFHAYHIPSVTNEVSVIIPSLEEIENNCMDDLKKIEKDIYLKNGSILNIECICKCGFAVDEILQFTQEKNIDLAVMGMQGSGYLLGKLIGSVTTALIRKAKCPVLAIDKHVKFKTIKKIVLASDYKEVDNKSILNPLKEFAAFFKSHVYVLNVIPELEMVSHLNKIAESQIEHSLEDVNHSFHYMENKDIVEGINDFVTQNKMDMLVMISRRHSVLRNIFHEPNTKHMAFHTRIPLLTLHE